VAGIEEKEQLALATMLDPQFKDNFFGGNVIKAATKEKFLEKMASATANIQPLQDSTALKKLRPLPITKYSLHTVLPDI